MDWYEKMLSEMTWVEQMLRVTWIVGLFVFGIAVIIGIIWAIARFMEM